MVRAERSLETDNGAPAALARRKTIAKRTKPVLYNRIIEGFAASSINNLRRLASQDDRVVIGVVRAWDDDQTAEPTYIVEAALDAGEKLMLYVQSITLDGPAIAHEWNYNKVGTRISYFDFLRTGRLVGRFARAGNDAFIRAYIMGLKQKARVLPGDDESTYEDS